jgi:Niemann-Pick C1 protein
MGGGPSPQAPLLTRWFYHQGLVAARYPVFFSAAAALVTLLCALGLRGIHFDSDPQKIWVAPDSAAAKQQQFFNEKVAPRVRRKWGRQGGRGGGEETEGSV